ncbi:uncharacterized protein LOC143205775 [Rhynchophorus ferrugineus]|uniref:uncharacterized protein LOC143205775 n=1 Tax=Rhynchophorus ferrugineus TaxID=354439 RepID=UPI003FCC9A8F
MSLSLYSQSPDTLAVPITLHLIQFTTSRFCVYFHIYYDILELRKLFITNRQLMPSYNGLPVVTGLISAIKTTEQIEGAIIKLTQDIQNTHKLSTISKMLVKIICNTNSKKAPGFDEISHFPKIWKHAHIIMIPKKKRPNNLPSGYRPISLLSSISKIVERNTQHVFRAKHSCAYQTTRLDVYFKKTLLKNKPFVQSFLASQRHLTKLQKQLSTAVQWLKLWRLDINPQKTQPIAFHRKRHLTIYKLQVDISPITRRNKATYLGLMFDKQNGYFNYGISSTLHPLLCCRGKLPPTIKVMLYNSLIRSVILFGSNTWSTYTAPTLIPKLQVMQNKLHWQARVCKLGTRVEKKSEVSSSPGFLE